MDVGRPALQQLYANAGCSLEDLPKAMNDRDVWQGLESEKSMLEARHDDDDLNILFLYTCVYQPIYLICVCV